MRSRRGRATLRARVTDTVAAGVAFAPFHWGALHLQPGAGALNGVVARAIDPTSLQAELKATRGPDRAGVDDAAGRPRGDAAPAGRRRRRHGGDGDRRGAARPRTPRNWEVTIVGAEPDPPYNRVLLSQALAGAVGEAELALRHPQWFAERGVDAAARRRGRATSTPRRRTVELADGERARLRRPRPRHGLAAVRPAGPRRRPAGRPRLPHARATRARSSRPRASAKRAVVIGGGLLGLEAARGLTERGVRTTVVHLADRLMEQQLDAPAASLLQRALRDLRIAVRTNARDRGDHDDGCRACSSDGEEIPADLVVIAAGIRPRRRPRAHRRPRGRARRPRRRRAAHQRARRPRGGRVRRAPRDVYGPVGAAAGAGSRARRRRSRGSPRPSTARRPRRR